jgi:hypothetical protein
MSSEAVLQKLQELRNQKKAEEEATRRKEEEAMRTKEQERRNVIADYTKRLEEGKVLWEAEILLQFESLDNNSIRNGFTPDKTLDQYINELLLKYKFTMPLQNKSTELKNMVLSALSRKTPGTLVEVEKEQSNSICIPANAVTVRTYNQSTPHHGGYIERTAYQVYDEKNNIAKIYTPAGGSRRVNDTVYMKMILNEISYKEFYDCRFALEEKEFKARIISDQMKKILQPIHRQREREKEQKEQELQAQKNAEKRERQLKAFQNLENLATNHCSYTTYKPLKDIDYNSNFHVHVLKKAKDNSGDWYHYKLQYHGVSQTSGGGYSTEGPVAEMADWFEQGLVPFCIKCPMCSNLTKFNFVTIDRSTPYQQSISKQANFREVYCPGHYFFNTRTNKHYISGGTEVIHIQRENPGEQARVICWEPDELQGNAPIPPRSWGQPIRDTRTRIGWKIWDPQDPDGSKEREREREKEKQDLQNQIALLQQKLQTI